MHRFERQVVLFLPQSVDQRIPCCVRKLITPLHRLKQHLSSFPGPLLDFIKSCPTHEVDFVVIDRFNERIMNSFVGQPAREPLSYPFPIYEVATGVRRQARPMLRLIGFLVIPLAMASLSTT